MFLTHAYYALWSFERLETNIKFSEWSLTYGNFFRWGGGYSVFNKWPNGFGVPAVDLTVPPFDCSISYWGSTFFNDDNVYSPDKIDEYVVNPQVKTSQPSTSSYLWSAQTDPQQILKDEIGQSFLYSFPFDGVKLADNYAQRLNVLHALKYSNHTFDLSINVKNYARTREYDASGVLESDTGWVITNLADGTGLTTTGVYRVQVSSNIVRSRFEGYYTYDIDTTRFESEYETNAGLIDVMRGYVETFNTVDGSEYDAEVSLIEDAGSFSNQVSEPTLGSNGGFQRRRGFYRFATSLKEMTMEDLADLYQVPY